MDADWWTAGAYQEVDGTHSLQLGRDGGRVLACQHNEDQYTVDGPLNFTYVGKTTELTAKITESDIAPPGEWFVVHATDPQAKSVTLTVPGEADVTGAVFDDTAVLYRPHAPGRIQGQAVVKDAAGKVIDQFGVN